MNREIKFRGKRHLNGEWVYGNLMIKQEESPIHARNLLKRVRPALIEATEQL